MTDKVPTLLKGVSCVLPCYNEASNVSQAISILDAALACELDKTVQDYEIICVDDGSQDATADQILSLQRHYSRLRLLRHHQNRGYGAALRTGFGASRLEWLFFSDADNQFDYSQIRAFLAQANPDQVLCGYREPRCDPWLRCFNGWAWNWLLRCLFSYPVRDVNCAFKLFHRSRLDLERLSSNGAAINAEMLACFLQRGLILRELPVSHRPRHSGRPSGARFRVVVRALWELGRLRFRTLLAG